MSHLTCNKWRQLELEERKARARRAFNKDDLPDLVERRFKELTEMTKPVIRPHSIFDQLDDEIKERVLRMIDVGPVEFTKMRRKGWKTPNMFQYAGRMALIIAKACNSRKRYLRESVDGGPVGKGKVKRISELTNKGGTKSSLGWDMSLSLYTRPEFRTDKHLKMITWILRATRAFTHLFPAEMELECARHVCYGRYDDGRLIAHQGRAPDWFYYVISGKIQMLRQYDLNSGMVTKSIGTLSKDMTTKPEELEQGIPREYNLVAKGAVEVLILHKSAFEELLQTNEGPPIDFLRNIELFEEFPIDEFMTHQESIEYKYYGENKVVVKDTNRTPWLHIVKSGQIKVVRRQDVVDTQSDQETFERQETDSLGCIKFPSHANAMLGYSYKQKKNRENLAKSTLSLPEISNQSDLVTNPHGQTLDGDEPLAVLQTIGEEDYENLSENAEDDQLSHTNSLVTQSLEPREEPHIVDNESGAASASEETKSEDEFVGMSVKGGNSNDTNKLLAPFSVGIRMKRIRKESSALPPINIPMAEMDPSDFQPHPFYLTREKTCASSVILPAASKEKERAERRAYLQLGALKAGDVFGLEHIEAPVASEGPGFSLVSDGAEVIRISKRFFLQNAKNNTMLKVDTLHKHYLNKEDAKTALYQQEVWSKYKSVLMQRIVKKVLQKHSPKHKKPKSQLDAPLGHTPRSMGSEVLVSRSPRK
ncbi:uncharacterized protein LOC135494004 isoform X2 [Lineus longissimus]|uniref:uncharacterized protein LOC135494004 isoform X2 n=1 Tax=Lineus longissimus TaxID=88925 RepID=UPI002B4C47F6